MGIPRPGEAACASRHIIEQPMEGLPGAPKLRFRHKLSIVLIGLALVPLVAAGVLVLRLLEQDKVSSVDSGLTTAAAAAGQSYLTQAADATTVATNIAGRSDVQQALKSGGRVKIQRLGTDLPSPFSVTFYQGKKEVGGRTPQP